MYVSITEEHHVPSLNGQSTLLTLIDIIDYLELLFEMFKEQNENRKKH